MKNSKEYSREHKRKQREKEGFKELERQRNKEYRENNKESISFQKSDYYKKNKEKINKKRKQEYQERKLRNVSFDTELTEFVVAEAKHLKELRNTSTGIVWSIDHVIPLRGSNVSGLHTWNNIQVIPLVNNKQKYNLYDENCLRYRNFFGSQEDPRSSN